MGNLVGRRVDQIIDITQPGDYCGPISIYTNGTAAVFYLLPGSRDPMAAPGHRSIHHVISPPHTFRECPDGSLEIRNSIGSPYWHGYLDEGHIWREV